MSSKNVSPRFVSVGNKTYRVATVSNAQKSGTGDWLAGVDSIDTFKGERIAVLKPI